MKNVDCGVVDRRTAGREHAQIPIYHSVRHPFGATCNIN